MTRGRNSNLINNTYIYPDVTGWVAKPYKGGRDASPVRKHPQAQPQPDVVICNNLGCKESGTH